MSLDAGRMLERLSQSFLEGSLFELSSAYDRSNGAGLGMLLAQLRNELEGAAGLLVEENRALRALMAEAADKLEPTALRERLLAASRGGEKTLRVPLLREENHALRRLLIDLQAHAEDVGQLGLEQRIWEELGESVRRREQLGSP